MAKHRVHDDRKGLSAHPPRFARESLIPVPSRLSHQQFASLISAGLDWTWHAPPSLGLSVALALRLSCAIMYVCTMIIYRIPVYYVLPAFDSSFLFGPSGFWVIRRAGRSVVLQRPGPSSASVSPKVHRCSSAAVALSPLFSSDSRYDRVSSL
ncbi:hypothetical protein C8Q78DRAFT_231031 [Trametes maxima]|nr:hypothetical protein C8Q78DRAFT_231031 [Trametes maxima]